MPSSVVASFQYNIQNAVLRVVYVSGSIYDYLAVPEDIYLAMKASPSKGTFLNTNIKEHFEYKKIK